MIRWAVFITASLVLHILILGIPFPVSFSEAPEKPGIVVDVELVKLVQPVQPVKKNPATRVTPSLPPAPVLQKKTEPFPKETPKRQVPAEDTVSVPEPLISVSGNEPKINPQSSSPAPREVTVTDTVRRVSPVYPLVSRRRGEEGEVRILASIDAGGKVAGVTVIETSGYPTLDESAIRAVRKWVFSPGSPEKLIVPVIFRLEQ